MEHIQFKANQTAAAYIAGSLDEGTEEAFELHLMDCSDCVEDVEVWRAIKHDMPKRPPEVRTLAQKPWFVTLTEWPMAASLLGVGLLGAAGGWAGRGTTAADLDSTKTVVSSLPSVSRGAEECTPVRLAPDTQVALVRVAGVAHDAHIAALDSDKREFPADQYTSRRQPDGSHLLRFNASLLISHAVHLELLRAGGVGEPFGCITGETQDLIR